MNKGFTLIEILVSLVILSLIGVICSQILTSAIEAEELSSKKLNAVKELSLSSSLVRRDLRQIINVPSRNFYGDTMPGTFFYDQTSNTIIFNTSIKNLSLTTSNINRVEYTAEDNTLIRKQYFSSSPYNQDDYTSSELIQKIDNLSFSFMYEKNWHQRWPLDKATSKKIPTLIRVNFSTETGDYFWLIDPNIDYEYQG